MPSKSKVCFFFEDHRIALTQRTRLKNFVNLIFKKEKRPLHSLNYVFCTDERVLEINRLYLKHDFYTDIITFDLSDSPETTGEVYISLDRVRDNAKSLNVPIRTELLRVIFHGALHLCGYKDKTKKDEALMRQKEEEYLLLFKSFT